LIAYVFFVIIKIMYKLAIEGTVYGLGEWEAWLDRMARSIYGMSAAEFESAYGVGHFSPNTVADDLASVIPLIRRLRVSAEMSKLTGTYST